MSLSSRVLRSNGANGAIAALAIALALTTGNDPFATRDSGPATLRVDANRAAPTTNAQGHPVLLDAGGWPVQLIQYDRIASASFVADPVLWDLGSPRRIIAFSEHSNRGAQSQRYLGKSQVTGNQRIESIIELAPDLLLVNSLGQRAKIDQLRSAGINVFDLGPMHGLSTFLKNVEQIGHLIGSPRRAQHLARQFAGRMARVSNANRDNDKPSALYLGSHAGHLYGGTVGTSYHDILTSAGLLDAGASDYRGWPAFTAEALLTLNPRYIVTQVSMAVTICNNPALSHLQACHRPGSMIEIESELLADPGMGMLEAAEELHARVFSVTHRPNIPEP